MDVVVDTNGLFFCQRADHTHAAMFEARVQTAIPPRAHVKSPHPVLVTLTPCERGEKIFLNVF